MAIIPMIFKPKGVGKTKKALRGLGATAKGLVASFGPLIIGMMGIQKAGQAIAASLRMKGEIDGVQKSFKSLGNTFAPVVKSIKGVSVELDAFSDKSLAKYKKAVGGTVSELELMKQANNAMLLGVIKSDDEFAELTEIAQTLAEAVGKDAAYGIESLTTGMGRQSKLMLDNLGIIVDTQLAYDVYAEKLGKTSKQLSEQERKLAFNEMALSKARELAEKAGGSQETMGKKMARASAVMQDMGVKLGTLLEPMVNLFLDVFTKIAVVVSGFLTTLDNFFGAVDWKETLGINTLILKWRDAFTLMFDIVNIVWNNLGLIMQTGFDFAMKNIVPTAIVYLEQLKDIIISAGKFLFEPLWIGMKFSWVLIKKNTLTSWEEIKHAFSKGALVIQQTFEVIGGYIKNYYVTIFNFIIDKVNSLITAINKPLEALGMDTIATLDSFNKVDFSEMENKHKKAFDNLNAEHKKAREDIEKPYDVELQGLGEDMENTGLSQFLKIDEDEVEENLTDVGQLIKDRIGEFGEEMFALKEEQQEELGGGAPPIPGTVTEADVEEQIGLFALHADALKNMTTANRASYEQGGKDFRNNLDMLAKESKAWSELNKAIKIRDILVGIPKTTRDAYDAGMSVGGPAAPIIGAAYAATAFASQMVQLQNIKKAAIGYSGQVSTPTMFMAGERGAENVNITPLNAPNIRGPKQANSTPINISFEGNVLSQEFIEAEAMPLIRDAIRRGELIND